MKAISFIDVILDFLFGLVSLIRICLGLGEAHDYVVLAFTGSFLAYAIFKTAKSCLSKPNNEENI